MSRRHFDVIMTLSACVRWGYKNNTYHISKLLKVFGDICPVGSVMIQKYHRLIYLQIYVISQEFRQGETVNTLWQTCFSEKTQSTTYSASAQMYQLRWLAPTECRDSVLLVWMNVDDVIVSRRQHCVLIMHFHWKPFDCSAEIPKTDPCFALLCNLSVYEVLAGTSVAFSRVSAPKDGGIQTRHQDIERMLDLQPYNLMKLSG